MTANLERERVEGEEAKRILESEVFARAFEDIREDFVQAIIDAPVRDQEGVMQLKTMIQLLDTVKSRLEDTMVTGRMADIQLERQAKAAQTGEK